jgi:hypothetical protein
MRCLIQWPVFAYEHDWYHFCWVRIGIRDHALIVVLKIEDNPCSVYCSFINYIRNVTDLK